MSARKMVGRRQRRADSPKRWGIRSFAIVALMLSGLAVHSAVAGASTPTWTLDASPTPGQGQLAAVSCVNPSFCVAAGAFDSASAEKTSIETLHGSTWTLTPTPVASSGDGFNGVSCTSTTSCFAVGSESNPFLQSLTERWNGTAWAVVPSPDPSPDVQLLAVSCASADYCMAVGTYSTTIGSPALNLVETWNGTSWSVAPSPNSGSESEQLEGVSCVSSTFCVAVGDTSVGGFVADWSGSAWTDTLDLGSAGDFGGVSCTSTTFCAAAGLGPSGQSLVEMWNGTSWTSTPTPSPGTEGSPLQAISCVNSTSCVAAGNSDGTREESNLVMSWDGTSWVVPSQPTVGNAYLTGVSCTGTTRCVAVGAQSGQTLIESENGDAPTISGISPNSGPKAGGTAVTITGSGFTSATSVAFGTGPALDVTVVSDTEITAVTPSAAPGVHNVYVTTPNGTNVSTATDHFSYLGPGVSLVSPNVGPRSGGTAVTIDGTDFTGAIKVMFGGVAATDFSVVSDTLITAHSPAEAAGVRNISVTTPDGTSTQGVADQYRFEARPVVTSISPSSGKGGAVVTVMGSGFSGASQIDFGTTPASQIRVVSDSELTVVAPAEAPAVRNVFVTSSSGTSAGVPGDRFTYTP
jgi:hypothetical protein